MLRLEMRACHCNFISFCKRIEKLKDNGWMGGIINMSACLHEIMLNDFLFFFRVA